MRKFWFVIVLFITGGLLSYAQNIDIKGRIVEKDNETLIPVAYANVILMDADSAVIAGSTTDKNGLFSINKIQQGNYFLNTSFTGYQNVSIELKNLLKSIDLGDIEIREVSVGLDEVTVSAAAMLNKLDRKIIFPSSKEINLSADGVELLRNMHLNGIQIKYEDNSITGIRGGEVSLRINGVRAGKNEVMAINPKDVIRIEYHDEPSMRHGDVEVVIDFIVRRRESGGSVMLNSYNALNRELTNQYAALKLNNKNSEFSLNYSFSHNYFGKGYQTNEEVFKFTDGSSFTRTEEGIPGKSKYNSHYVNAGYSLAEVDKYVFAANFQFSRTNTPFDNTYSLLYKNGEKENGVYKTNLTHSGSLSPSMNIYFQRNFKNDHLLIIDAVWTYIGSDSYRHYSEMYGADTLTNIITNTKGEKHSLIGEVIYEKLFNVGRISAGVKHTHNFSNNLYDGNYSGKTKMQNSFTYFYAQWMGRIKKFTYSGGLGGTATTINQVNQKPYSDVRFSPTLRMAYQFNDKIQLRYRGDMMVQTPPLSELNAVDLPIDSLQIRRGNPALKPWTSYLNRLTFSYNSEFFRFGAEVYDHYSIDPVMESTVRENDKFVRVMENHSVWHQVLSTGYVNLSLLKEHIYVYAQGGLNWIENGGEKYNHIIRNWFINSSVSANWKNWSIYGGIYTRRMNIVGELVTSGQQSVETGIGYHWKNLRVNMNMFFPFGGWNSETDNKNQYASSLLRYYTPDLKNMLTLNVSWNMEFGRRYRSVQKRINNSDTDSGVLEVGK